MQLIVGFSEHIDLLVICNRHGVPAVQDDDPVNEYTMDTAKLQVGG